MKTYNAYIEFHSEDEGGRSKAIFTGYRAVVSFDKENYTDAVLNFHSEKTCEPGSGVSADVTFLHPENVRDHLAQNAEFSVHEGTRTIGTGRIDSARSQH